MEAVITFFALVVGDWSFITGFTSEVILMFLTANFFRVAQRGTDLVGYETRARGRAFSRALSALVFFLPSWFVPFFTAIYCETENIDASQ